MILKDKYLFLLLLLCAVQAAGQEYNVLQYHAAGDGKTLNTAAIQQAVNECANKGGGRVLVPAGVFLTGGIVLKNKVNLHLMPGAVLLAAPSDTSCRAVVHIYKAQGASVTGEGTIDGNGHNFTVAEAATGRPYLVYVQESTDVIITGVRLRQSASWSLRLHRSRHVTISNVSIYSHANYNNDGIDIDSKDVVISNCIVDCGDDALCFKSDDRKVLCENVTVNNCMLASNCNFIKMGTSSYGGFRNIAVTNCVLRKATVSPLHHWYRQSNQTFSDSISGLAGIALEVVDGGILEQVTLSNITMTGVQTPIFMRLGSRKNATGVLRNVMISQVTATSCSQIPCLISAVPGFYIEDVTLRDITVTVPGNGSASAVSRPVPEKEASYPENRMFGWTLPAYGLYMRHAKGIRLYNLRFHTMQADQRPAIWLDDVQDAVIQARGIPATAVKQINTQHITVTE